MFIVRRTPGGFELKCCCKLGSRTRIEYVPLVVEGARSLK